MPKLAWIKEDWIAADSLGKAMMVVILIASVMLFVTVAIGLATA